MFDFHHCHWFVLETSLPEICNGEPLLIFTLSSMSAPSPNRSSATFLLIVVRSSEDISTPSSMMSDKDGSGGGGIAEDKEEGEGSETK